MIEINSRFGNLTCSTPPTIDEIKAIIEEIYEENNPNLTESDYIEHPNAWINYGFESGDNWSVFTLDLYRNKTLRVEFWTDQDYDGPELEKVIENISKGKVIELWYELSCGNTSKIINEIENS